MAEITVLIRYKNSSGTLPEVLDSLSKQTRLPEHIIAVDTGSTDGSTDILRKAGAEIFEWNAPYHHSKVLNFGISNCKTPLVLCLSSHTVLTSPDIIEKFAEELRDPTICAASIRWDNDEYYSDRIGWDEMKEKGIKFGSVYSNSAGLFRKKLWENYPFDEVINGVEDYDWALYQMRAGSFVARIDSNVRYQRSAHNRDRLYAAIVFTLSHRYGLKVTWIGHAAALKSMLSNLLGKLRGRPKETNDFDTCYRRFTGALFWRFINVNIDQIKP